MHTLYETIGRHVDGVMTAISNKPTCKHWRIYNGRCAWQTRRSNNVTLSRQWNWSDQCQVNTLRYVTSRGQCAATDQLCVYGADYEHSLILASQCTAEIARFSQCL